MTQNDLAEKIGLSEKQISKIETGVHYPKFENFIKILDVLGVQMKDFDNEIPCENNVLRNSIIKTLYKFTEPELKYCAVLIKQLDKLIKDKRK